MFLYIYPIYQCAKECADNPQPQKGLNILTKKDIEIVNIFVERYSISLVTKEIQIKTTKRYPTHPPE